MVAGFPACKTAFMKSTIISIAYIFLVILSCSSQVYKKDDALAHTFSIIARDPTTGEMGVGVQSHWFSVGTAVPWAEAGVGVVATQSFVNKSYGIKGLALMKSGLSAPAALKKLMDEDEGRELRQVAMLDSNGHVMSFTGNKCIDYAVSTIGNNFSVQSNMMFGNNVNASMANAYMNSSGKPLAERILIALQAGQLAGGDIRGKQSAAILVVAGQSGKTPWDDRLIDLRVDDNSSPLKELDRLLRLYRAYEHMNKGDLATEKNDIPMAMKEYGEAMKMFPQNLEMQYWTAITLANNKKIKEASVILHKLYLKDIHWRVLTSRLPKVNLLTVTPAELKLLTK